MSTRNSELLRFVISRYHVIESGEAENLLVTSRNVRMGEEFD
jgi:hypothetical protein